MQLPRLLDEVRSRLHQPITVGIWDPGSQGVLCATQTTPGQFPPPLTALNPEELEPHGSIIELPAAAFAPGARRLTTASTHENDTCEELLDLSRANAQALVLATAAFLEASGVPLEAWVGFIGRVYANSWDPLLELSAGEFLDAMLTNYKSFGAEVLSTKLGDDVAEATITGFPKRELAIELQIDMELAMPYLNVPEALAADNGLRWSWSVDGGRIRLLVSRAA